MTIAVALEHLADAVTHFGSAVLVTQCAGTWPRVLTCDPVVEGIELVIVDPPEVFHRNVAANELVTVVWPATVHHGFTLIVDGWARVEGADLRVRLDHAVLHRPAPHSDGPPAPVIG